MVLSFERRAILLIWRANDTAISQQDERQMQAQVRVGRRQPRILMLKRC